MPAKECDNGKWKWGTYGECKYDSKAEAEADNEDYRALEDISLDVNEGMVEEAKRGLAWRKEFGRGGTEVGVRTANMIINNTMTIERVKKMYAYFKRHEPYQDSEGFKVGEEGYPSNSRIAHSLWGGDSGFSWSEKKRNQIVNEEEKRVSAKIKKALENKVEEHNEEIKDLNLDWNARVTFKTLEKVFDRGVGAYNTNPQSVRPSVKSSDQWALARVNSFLYALKKGKYRSGKHDTDLLPKDHPVRKKMDEEKNKTMDNENRTLIGTLITDGIELPLYTTKEEAEAYAEEMGGSGSHSHNVDGTDYFMPFSTHEEAVEIMGEENMEEKYHYDEEEEEKQNRSIIECKECEDDCEDECIKGSEVIGEKKIKYIWDKKYNNITMEKRIYDIETRVHEDNDKMTVVGHASLYNSRSEDLGGFYEYIQEGAFTEELIAKSDVRALINHDPNLILARNTAGTLKLTPDAKGLRYEFDIPNTSYGRDLAENLRNGNISQSSFAFTVKSDQWSTDQEGRDIRTITEIDRLYDISSVTYPAYALAESELLVAKRGLDTYKEKKEMEKEEKFLVMRSLAKLKIEIAKRK